MTYGEAIKEGFSALNRNWQLVLVQLVVSIISCMGFIFIVALPIVIALLIIGFNPLTIVSLSHSPQAILSQNLGLLILVGGLLILYILCISTLGLYLYGAAAGMISRGIMDDSERFSMNAFFAEGKRLFFPVIGYTALTGLIAIGMLLLFGISALGAFTLISYAKSLSLTLSIFIGVFFSITGIIIGALSLFGILSVTVYGTGSLAMKGTTVTEALKDAFRYLSDRPQAFWFYVLLSLAYFIFSILLSLIGLPLRAIPFVGLILGLPYQILVYALQGYAGLMLISIVFSYYYGTEVFTPGVISGTSTPETGTSSKDQGQDPSRNPSLSGE